MGSQATGSTPTNEMSHLTVLSTTLLTLGLLAGRAVTAPPPAPRAPPSVSFILTSLPRQPF